VLAQFSPALDELQRAMTHAHSAARHALEGLSARREPLVLNPKAVSFTEIVSRAQKRKAFAKVAKGRVETARGTIRRDSSGNIRCDSGNIRLDSGNGKVKTSLPPPVKARVLFQKDIPAVAPLITHLRKEKKRPDTPRCPRETVFNAAVSQLSSMVISTEDHCFGSPFAFSPPRANTREKKGRRMANIYTKGGADGSSWWRNKVDRVAPFLQEPAIAPGPVSPLKEEKEKVEKMEKGMEEVDKGMEKEEQKEEVDKVEIPQKEQIELAVRMLHKIASSGKIQIMLQQNEEATLGGSPRGPIIKVTLQRIFTERSLNVPWMFLECSLNAP
jgi:hypothetical protein